MHMLHCECSSCFKKHTHIHMIRIKIKWELSQVGETFMSTTASNSVNSQFVLMRWCLTFYAPGQKSMNWCQGNIDKLWASENTSPASKYGLMLGIYSFDFQGARFEYQYVCCCGAYTTELICWCTSIKKTHLERQSLHQFIAAWLKEVHIYIYHIWFYIPLPPSQPTLKCTSSNHHI